MKKISIKLFHFLLIFVIIINTLLFYGNADGGYIPSDTFAHTISALTLTQPKPQGAVRIMTYNLLADTPGFYGSPAYSRGAEVCSLINALSPDVAGLQEVSRNWFYTLSTNTDYKFIAPLKTTVYGTMTTIIYNPHTLLLEEWGEHTFSDSHNGRLRRAVWGLFRVRATGKALVVINTHLSLSQKERYTPLTQATELLSLCRSLSQRYACTLLLVGDLNSDRGDGTTDSAPYEIISTYLTDARLTADQKIHGNAKGITAHCVDHLFASNGTEILRYTLLSHSCFSPLSDHYPVFVDTWA